MKRSIKEYWRKKGDLKDTETVSRYTVKTELSKIRKGNSINNLAPGFAQCNTDKSSEVPGHNGIHVFKYKNHVYQRQTGS